jgi:diguanylate cyclase (GGDEF)-like protein
MIHFLTEVDQYGLITDVKWCEPTSLFINEQTLLPELFITEDIDQNVDHFWEKAQHGHFFQIENAPRLRDQNVRILLYALKLSQQFLIFGVESLFADAADISELYNVEKNSMIQHEAVIDQFERIQSLNNQLINTQRKLGKANAQLKVLNEDLNNRLVKDALTGLVSRYQYRTEIEDLIKRNPDKLGVFTFLDVDYFKTINDTYGHAAGDAFLIEFANRLKKLSIANTIRIRIAGDEFGLFTYGLDQVVPADITEMWTLIQNEVLLNPIIFDRMSVIPSVSAGMAVFGEDTTSIYQVIEYADFAMYQAKRKGKNGYHLFNVSEYGSVRGITYKEVVKGP